MIHYPTRKDLSAAMPRGGIVAEIGVQWGEHAAVILEYNKPGKLYLIDCWEFQEGDYEKDPAAGDATKQQRCYENVVRRFSGKPVEIIRKYSLEAVSLFPDEHFDWLYIDANHQYDYITADLKAWWPKVKPGGFLCGHDYFESDKVNWIDVKRAVDEFCASQGVELYAITDEKWASWCIQKVASGAAASSL